MDIARRRGFALIIALLTTAAIFALTMQGSVAMRAATIETSALHRRSQGARDAAGAARIVLAGLSTLAPAREQVSQNSPSGAAETANELLDDDDAPEMPEVMQQFLKDLGADLDEKDKRENETPEQRERRETNEIRKRRSGVVRTLGLPGVPVEVELEGRRYAVSLYDAVGGVNLNEAEEPQLRAFFEAHGAVPSKAEAVAHQLLDWRDEDDYYRTRGAEKDHHARRGVQIRNGPLLAVEELLYLPAMTRALYDAVRSDVVLAGDGRLHVGSASPEALSSVPGIPADLVREICLLRSAGMLDAARSQEELESLPREKREMLRFACSSSLRIRVVPVASKGSSSLSGPVFEGYAAFASDGRIELSAFKAVSRAPEEN